jgi:hypothetical protein
MTAIDTQATSETRRLGLMCAASGVLMVLMAVPLGIHIGAIPTHQWSYPHPAGIFLVEEVLLTIAHLLSAAGFLGALRLRAQGTDTTGRAGLWAAVAGLVGLSSAELASGFIGGEAMDSGIATMVSTIFGITSLVFAIGAIVGGIAILRAGVWQGPWRWVVLATGIVIIVLVTPANISGSLVLRQGALLIWSLLFIPLGVDVARRLNGGEGQGLSPAGRHRFGVSR